MEVLRIWNAGSHARGRIVFTEQSSCQAIIELINDDIEDLESDPIAPSIEQVCNILSVKNITFF